MNRWRKRCLYWTPRIVSILFVALASVQAVYALGAGFTTWKTILSQQATWHGWGLWI